MSSDAPIDDPTKERPKHEQLYELAMTNFARGSKQQLLIAGAAQVLKTIDDAGYNFHVSLVVSLQTGGGKLDIVWGGYAAQLELPKAREIALMLIAAAAIADSEAGVMRFMSEKLGVTAEQSAAVLGDFRKYRDARRTAASKDE